MFYMCAFSLCINCTSGNMCVCKFLVRLYVCKFSMVCERLFFSVCIIILQIQGRNKVGKRTLLNSPPLVLPQTLPPSMPRPMVASLCLVSATSAFLKPFSYSNSIIRPPIQTKIFLL